MHNERMTRPITDVRSHLLLYSTVDERNGCWLWSRATAGQQGYGRIQLPGSVQKLAHVASYEVFVGPVPIGLELDHLCRQRSCIRPDHLEAVTHAENVRRGLAGDLRPPKTHCNYGHEMAGENLMMRKRREKMGRSCRTCHRAQVAGYRTKRKAAAN